MRSISLTGPLDWGKTAIPGGTPEVDICRLRVDPVTKASTSLVRFPAGWSRSADVFYAVDEEIVILDGELLVSGVSYTEGQYGFIPAGSLRRASATPDGCLALAHFAGIPAAMSMENAAETEVGPTIRLDLGTHHAGTTSGPFGVGQRLRSRDYGDCWLVSGATSLASMTGATEALSIDNAWMWIDLTSDGDVLADATESGRYLVR